MTRLALLERLKEVQQMPRYQGRDIMTISAALSNQALARHVELCEEAAGATPRFARPVAGKPGGCRPAGPEEGMLQAGAEGRTTRHATVDPGRTPTREHIAFQELKREFVSAAAEAHPLMWRQGRDARRARLL